MKYRSDIDGLRSIAVGSVLLYHANLFGVTGGFVGVDIFFVISGYLITHILQNDIAAGQFSLLHFYDRRIRRIVPAYTLTIIATTIAAYAVLPPAELAGYGRRLASTAAFVSNFFFRSESGYFAPASGDNPLLHTWSLSVEEQFYIVWPLLIFALLRPPLVRWRHQIVLLCFILSLALAVYTAFVRPLTAFFYSPLRAWELLLGAMLAMGFVPHLRRKANEAAATLGVVLILAPILLYTNGTTTFPGATALPPCLGAALIILAGRDGPTCVSRILSLKPLVFTGLISYSLYLWHWPILVFTHLYLDLDLSPATAITALIVSYILASLTWYWVERSFRKHPDSLAGIPQSIPVGLSALLVLLTIGIVTDVQNGWPERSNNGVIVAQAEMGLPARGQEGCMVEAAYGTRPTERGCLLGPGGEDDVQAILLGDSHAGAYSAAVNDIAYELKFTARQWTKSSCYPILTEPSTTFWNHYFPNREEESCRVYLQTALEHVTADSKIKTVIVAGFWSNMQDDKEANAARRAAGPAAQTQLRTGLERLVAKLRDAGKTVILLGQVPVFPNGGGDCVIRQRFLARNAAKICSVPQSYEKALLAPSDSILMELAQRYKDVYVYRGSSEFCAADVCSPIFDGHLALRDEHHLSFPGSIHLVPRMKAVFEQAGIAKFFCCATGAIE